MEQHYVSWYKFGFGSNFDNISYLDGVPGSLLPLVGKWMEDYGQGVVLLGI